MNWIKIEEETPRKGQKVIAVGTWWGEISDLGEEGYMGIGEWNGVHINIDSDTYTTLIIDITHWMPLPEHP